MKKTFSKHLGGNEIFRGRVLVRDNYTCQICGLRDEDIMVVDHIVPRHINPDLVIEIYNVMTICPNCHAKKTIRDIKHGLLWRKWEIVKKKKK